MMFTYIKKYFKAIIKGLLGVCYCLALAELLLRLIDPVPMLPRYVCAMPYGIRGNDPNKYYVHRTAEYTVHIQTNSKGIRSDHEIPYEKPAGVKRIVLLGDSFGMGYGVEYKQMFSSRLEYYLKVNYGIHAEVVNLSTSGHGNAEELIVLQEEGLKYHPDLVLLCWHITDLNDNIRSNLYKLVDGRLQRNAKTYLPGVKARDYLFSIPGYQFLAENSNLYNFLRDWAAVKVKALLVKMRSMKKAVPKMSVSKKAVSNRVALTIALIREIQRVSQINAAEFMILDIPVRMGRSEFASRFPTQVYNDIDDLHVLSPIGNFKQAKGQKVYWERSHGHFTPLGCDLVGKALARYIEDKQLLH